MGLALVETDLSLALETGVENPVDHEQGALDATDLPQCEGQLILARVGSELAKNLAGGDDAARPFSSARALLASTSALRTGTVSISV